MNQADICNQLNKTVTTRFEILTPDQMIELKERSEQAIADGKLKQRPQQRYSVAKYLRDIANGDWLANPQPITITKEGLVIDGMHRITAGAKSGVPVLFNVTRNWYMPESFRVIDTGRVRDNKAILTLAGVENAVAFNSIARSLVAICLGWKNISTQVSVHEVERVMHCFEGGFKSVLNTINRHTSLSACRIKSEGIAAIVFLENIFPNEIEEFSDALFGMNFSVGHPARAVRLYVDKSKRTQTLKGEIARMILNGIKSAVEKQSVQRLSDKEEGIVWARKINIEKVKSVAAIFGVTAAECSID